MLVIDLPRLSQAPVELEGEIAPDDPLWSGTAVELASPLRVEATAEGSAARGIWLRARLSAHICTVCRRCLQALEVEVEEEFAVIFDPKTSEGDGDLTVYGFDPAAEELDLRPALRERLLLAVPAYPLCREGCAGFCGRCGANLNEGDCGCEPTDMDPRWGPLQDLRSES